MGKVRQKLNALRAHWFQILVACGALALAFGLGMSFQADFVEQAAREDQIRGSLYSFSNKMDIFSNDVDRMIRQAEQAQAAGEPVDDPMENWVISGRLALLREQAVVFADIRDLPQSHHCPNAKIYVNSWKYALLRADCDDLNDLAEVIAICRPIWDLDHEQPCKEIMAQLEGYVTSGDYQDALDLLGLEFVDNWDLLLTTTQGGI